MSRFVPRWSSWKEREEFSFSDKLVDTGSLVASEISRRAFAGSAGSQVGPSGEFITTPRKSQALSKSYAPCGEELENDFVRRWSSWGECEGLASGEELVEKGHQGTGKTSKRASAGFAGSQGARSELSPGRQTKLEEVAGSPDPSDKCLETGYLDTSKTCEKASAGFAGTQGGHSRSSIGLPQRSETDPERHEARAGRQGEPYVEEMTLEEFAQTGLVVQVRSEVLGSSVLFVSDNVPESRFADSDLPIYRAAELRKLAVLKPEPRTLRSLHEVKTLFEGVISDVHPKDD